MNTYPKTDVRDLLLLLGSSLEVLFARPQDFKIGEILTIWLDRVLLRHHSKNVILNLLFKNILLVSERDLSAQIFQEPPASQRYIAGELKQKSMSFLAPAALTISHDAQWQRLRPYHEQVLCSHARHTYQQAFLAQVQQAFASPVASIQEIQQRMGIAMLGIVFGEKVAPIELIADIEVLFSLVGNPVKRLLAGNRELDRRQRFYDRLRQLWRDSAGSTQPSLLSIAHQVKPDTSEAELIQQIPHWMFTFTGSGTDLLARTFALITSRPAILERVQREIAEQGSLDAAETIGRLAYLEACLLETGRLYPPVTLTFHVAPQGDTFEGMQIPKGMEILHFFPLMQRSIAAAASTDRFEPERWLDPSATPESHLFLSGARLCPGKDLILFVCKSAIALLIHKHHLRAINPLLERDPLPLSFPHTDLS